MKRLTTLIVLLLLIISCARIVTPVGGPKDITPPEILKTKPENGTLFFLDNTIRIYFNEFVTLNVPLENIIISPPMASSPDYILSGKSLSIRFTDSLLPNRTYNIAFSNAIKDFTEGNLLPYYQYTFSTGSYIDSFMVSGVLINAQTLAPEPNVNIMLYDENIDSLPYSVKPLYLTKSQQDGTFSFLHIAEGDYKIFALKDINNNLIFDLPNEGIAFLDSVISAYPIPKYDTTENLNFDTLDLEIVEDITSKQPEIKLLFFVEEDTVQRVERPVNPSPGIYKHIYKKPFTFFEARQIKPEMEFPYFESVGSNKDTVTWYYSVPVIDTLIYELTADQKIDTATILPYKPPSSRGRGAVVTPQNKLTVSHTNAGNLFYPLTLYFSYPIKPVDSFEVMVVANKKSSSDTLFYYYSIPDTFTMSKRLTFPMEEKVPYVVQIKDSVFSGYDESTNDTITIRFTSKSEKEYGNLRLNYQLPENKGQYIIILQNSESKVVREDIIHTSSVLDYMHLMPGEYMIKVIDDINGNGKWDTGNYREKIQPEHILFFDKPINIRGYWDLEEVFEIGNVHGH